MLADASDRLDLVAGVLEHTAPHRVLIPLALVEDEEAVLAGDFDEIAHLGAGEELPAGCAAAACGVEAADSKFMGVHGCLPCDVRRRRRHLACAHGLSSADVTRRPWPQCDV